ncbi:MAG TPA: J domain-containing protein [Myxococcaceae bacterium]|nr:J domain-containing protein [Myxococcaceae bacterium]
MDGGRVMGDYYGVLGVPPSADERTLRQAYQQLAMKYHPDRNKSPEAVVEFRRVQEAYEALRTPERRAAYDRQQAAARRVAAPGASADAFTDSLTHAITEAFKKAQQAAVRRAERTIQMPNMRVTVKFRTS